MMKIWLPIIFASLTFSACGRRSLPDLGGIYNKSAQKSDLERNPVIVIPGLLGSKLTDQDSGRLVWGAFGGQYVNPTKPEGARLMSLPMKQGTSLNALKDNVEATGVLDTIKIRFFGLPLELGAYFNLIMTLGAGGYRDRELGMAGAVDYGEEHFTCFQFPYDWRRDAVESAKKLDKYIKEQHAYVQSEFKKRYNTEKEDLKFDLVAHSMGCNVVRYYLRYGAQDLPADGSLPELNWAGAKHINKVIMVGPPNGGAAKGLSEMILGRKIGPGFPTVPPAVVGTFPAGYQILPRNRHKRVVWDANKEKPIPDIYDPEVWIKNQWGLANPDQDKVLAWLLPDEADPQKRRDIAIDHLRKSLKRGHQFVRALDVPAARPKGLELFLVAGDADPTPAVISVNQETGEIEDLESWPGDATVTRASALLDERIGGQDAPRLVSPIDWSQVFFIFNSHLGLTKDPAFTDNILYVLLEKP